MDFKKILINEEFQDLNLKKVRRIIGWGIAEMLGTAYFISLGCASTTPLMDGAYNSHLSVAIAFSSAIGLSIMIFGPISLALMNPGLGLIMVILGHITIVKYLYYCVFQLLGAYLGVLLVFLVTPDLSDGFCMTTPNPEISLLAACLIEFWTSTMFGFGMCNAVDPRQEKNIGLIFMKFFVIVLTVAMASPRYSGCSMNPARSFGPALLAWNWKNHWIYWVATMGGMGFSAVFYKYVLAKEIYTDEKKADEKKADEKKETGEPKSVI